MKFLTKILAYVAIFATRCAKQILKN